VDNSALLYIWVEQQPLASRATAARSAAVARHSESEDVCVNFKKRYH